MDDSGVEVGEGPGRALLVPAEEMEGFEASSGDFPGANPPVTN